MGTVTAYNLANVQAALGGSNPISMSEYYRGGSYVPTTRSTTVTEGPYYSYSPTTDWFTGTGGNTFAVIRWFGVQIALSPAIDSYTTAYATGGYIYYKNAFREYVYGKGMTFTVYDLYRTYPSSASINTGVPSSGAISISQLYGAANP